MSTSINGTGGVTFNDGSVLGSQLGIFNRIIDGGFIINQRGYISGTSLSAGAYGHDRWKAGSSGCTYTFTQGALGVNTTITITAGTIVQVIEGCNLAEGGTYVLSWTGTAQGRLNGGTYGSSGTVTVTGWTAGTNLNVEFNTGTLGNVQLVAGSAVSSYAYRPYGTELALCQRYLPAFNSTSTGDFICNGFVVSSTQSFFLFPFVVQPRVPPTGMSISSSSHFASNQVGGAGANCNPIFNGAGFKTCRIQATISGGTAGQGAELYATSTSGQMLFTGCEL